LEWKNIYLKLFLLEIEKTLISHCSTKQLKTLTNHEEILRYSLRGDTIVLCQRTFTAANT